MSATVPDELDTSISLALVDLVSCKVEPAKIVEACQAANSEIKVVGFSPHVDRELIQSARDAGFTEVLTRGQFDNGLANGFFDAYAD